MHRKKSIPPLTNTRIRWCQMLMLSRQGQRNVISHPQEHYKTSNYIIHIHFNFKQKQHYPGVRFLLFVFFLNVIKKWDDEGRNEKEAGL